MGLQVCFGVFFFVFVVLCVCVYKHSQTSLWILDDKMLGYLERLF